MKHTLYFATNRAHQGENRWRPTGYGKEFSHDGHYNLRFGRIEIEANDEQIDQHLNHNFGAGRHGDGEKLLAYLAKQSQHGAIEAFEDHTAEATDVIAWENNSSTRFFKALKGFMDDGSDVVIYIHGYNVSWNEAAGSAAALELMLNRNVDDPMQQTRVVLFSWPSDGSMMPFAAYKSDRSDARDSAQAVGRAFLKLRDFLHHIKPGQEDPAMLPCDQNIHLLCHSMGNYVLQNALKKLVGYNPGQRLPQLFKNIFLCAADVDDDALEQSGKMASIHELCDHLSVYYNQGDLAMYISDYTKGHPQRLGHTGAARPGDIHNKIHQVNCSPVVKGMVEHSYYLWASVNEDIRQTIREIPFDGPGRRRKKLSGHRLWEMI